MSKLTSLEKRKQLREHLTLAKTSLATKEKPLKANPPERLKQKENLKSKKQSKIYDSAKGLEYPIYMFDFKGKRICKIVSRDMLTDVGVSGVSAAVSVRDKAMFRGVFLSYDKKIDVSEFKTN